MNLVTNLSVSFPRVRYGLPKPERRPQANHSQPVDIEPVLISTTPPTRLSLLKDYVVAIAPIVAAILKLFGG